jgi:aryl-alcohol dehydrogenase-like predicted oxidoreductase
VVDGSNVRAHEPNMNPETSLYAPRASVRAALVLGCMNFGKRTPEPEAERIVRRARETGVSLFDTANAYGDGESERILGRILKRLPSELRQGVEVATKTGWWRREGLAPERVVTSLDESLERLGIDAVDLYYLHVPDHETPIEATMEGIAKVLESGKAKRFGLSNFASWQILEVINLCDRMKLPRPAVSQQLYNLLIRQLDLEYARFSRKYGLHTTVYNPLAGGLLTDREDPARVRPGSRFDKNGLYQRRYLSEVFFDATAAFSDLARESGMSLVTMAYAWLMARPLVDSILIGPGSLPHLEDALKASSITLSDAQLLAIDAIHRQLVGTDASYAR